MFYVFVIRLLAAAALGVSLTVPSIASHGRGIDLDPPACRDDSGLRRRDDPARSGPVAGSGAKNLAVSGEILLFGGCTAATGWELWRSDGSASGTRRVADLRPGRAGSAPSRLTDAGGAVYFLANDGAHGREMWRSDGTPRGTRIVADLVPGAAGAEIGEMYWAPTLERLFFVFDDGIHGRELWSTDGTAEGTDIVADLVPGAGHSDPTGLREYDGGLFWIADARPWLVDPTPRDVFALRDGAISRVTYLRSGGSPRLLTVYDGALLVGAQRRDGEEGIWRIDGRDGLAVRVDLGPDWPHPYSVTSHDGALYFIAHVPDPDGYYHEELFKTDLTREGTVQLSQISVEDFRAFSLRAVGDTLYFYGGVSDDYRRGLWSSDGTVEGTRLVRDVRFGTCRKLPAGELVPVGSRVFFVGHQHVRGELWVSDGTERGTRLVRDIYEGVHPSKPRDTVAFGERLAFTANDGRHGRELWVSDGTEKGTRMVKDIFAPKRSRPRRRLPVTSSVR